MNTGYSVNVFVFTACAFIRKWKCVLFPFVVVLIHPFIPVNRRYLRGQERQKTVQGWQMHGFSWMFWCLLSRYLFYESFVYLCLSVFYNQTERRQINKHPLGINKGERGVNGIFWALRTPESLQDFWKRTGFIDLKARSCLDSCMHSFLIMYVRMYVQLVSWQRATIRLSHQSGLNKEAMDISINIYTRFIWSSSLLMCWNDRACNTSFFVLL